MQAVRWLSVLFLWGGVIGVIVSVFTITPETATGRGAVPLVGDVPLAGDQLSAPPPGVQSVVPGLEPGGGAGAVGEAIGSTSDYNPVTQGGNAVTSAHPGSAQSRGAQRVGLVGQDWGKARRRSTGTGYLLQPCCCQILQLWSFS